MKKEGEWVSVSLPEPLVQRVDRVWRRLGYGSRAEYIRMAVLAQLRQDEYEGRSAEEA